MNPGDMIEWTYKSDGKVIEYDEMLWSSVMNKWVPISGYAWLITIDDKTYTWLNSRGLFHARIEDRSYILQRNSTAVVIPRVVKQ